MLDLTVSAEKEYYLISIFPMEYLIGKKRFQSIEILISLDKSGPILVLRIKHFPRRRILSL